MTVPGIEVLRINSENEFSELSKASKAKFVLYGAGSMINTSLEISFLSLVLNAKVENEGSLMFGVEIDATLKLDGVVRYEVENERDYFYEDISSYSVVNELEVLESSYLLFEIDIEEREIRIFNRKY